MPIISLYANQTVALRRYSGIKDNGQPIFEPEVLIKGRFEEKRSLIRNAKGQEVVSEAFIITAEKLSEGDVLVYAGRNWTILRISAPVGLDGKVTHYEGWL